MSYPNAQELSRRRIRIESGPDTVHGWMVRITDVETGEEVTHVARAVITLDARELNSVELTYFAHDEHGKVLVEHGQPVIETVTVGSPEVSVTAIELTSPGWAEEQEDQHGPHH